MQSTSADVTIANGALRACIDFETGGQEELYCAVDGGPDSNCPNANATDLHMCIDFPLGFNPTTRYITVGEPEVDVTATWNITIGLNYDVSDKVNTELTSAVKTYLKDVTSSLSTNLTRLFHDALLSDTHGNHGEILTFQAGDSAILLTAKSASGTYAFCPQ
jgi:hypothetical protein